MDTKKYKLKRDQRVMTPDGPGTVDGYGYPPGPKNEPTSIWVMLDNNGQPRFRGYGLNEDIRPLPVDREGRVLRGVTATQLIDLLQDHVDTHGNTEVLIDNEDGFGFTLREARSRESYQSNPLVFVVQIDITDEPQQLGE